jgi:hypothetical protein
MKQKLNEEQILKRYIKGLVRESLTRLLENYYFEAESSDSNNDSSNSDSSYTNNSNSQNKGNSTNFKRKRMQVQKFFSQDGINPAAYAYKLFNTEPVEGKDTNEMKNARSLFMKKLHNEQNQDGSTYEFTSEEVNRLYSLISGSELA